jgi:hypothetical protein
MIAWRLMMLLRRLWRAQQRSSRDTHPLLQNGLTF